LLPPVGPFPPTPGRRNLSSLAASLPVVTLDVTHTSDHTQRRHDPQLPRQAHA
jgi:hypothetical protein